MLTAAVVHLLFLISGVILHVVAQRPCPTGCICLPDNYVSCEDGSRTSIPTASQLSTSVRTLILKGNRFTSTIIERQNFSSFTSLEELTVQNCGIESIGFQAFVDLSRLKKLDLSLNSIRTIGRETFIGLQLNSLFLDSNPNMEVRSGTFQGMSTELLSLEKCALTDVNPATFEALKGKTKKLFLGDNNIARFSHELLSLFESLEKIKIHDNPLICDCEARWLKIFYDSNQKKMRGPEQGTQEPRCTAPASINGFLYRLTLNHFECMAPTIDAVVSFTETEGIITCTVKGTPLPKLIGHRPNGVKTFANTNTDNLTIRAAIDDSGVHGKYRCTADNIAGNTSLTVNMSWPFTSESSTLPCDSAVTESSKDVEVTPGVTDEPKQVESNIFKEKYFTLVDLISAIFGTFIGTLIVCVTVLHFCVYKKRKPASQYSTPPMSEYSAGSIKNGGYPPVMHNTIQSRPLPFKPPSSKAFDENHYMATNLDESHEFIHMAHHSDIITPPPCEACRTMNNSRVS